MNTNEKNLTGVKGFLNKEFLKRKTEIEPENFDFKFFMQEYYKCWDTRGIYTDLINELEKEIGSPENKDGKITNIGRWLAYKTSDVIYYEDKKKKNESINKFVYFDCDNSNDTCALTKEIYYYLWGWKKYKGKSNFGDSLVWGKDSAMGGDTMNSFATTMIQYFKMLFLDPNINSVMECKNLYDENKEDFIDSFKNSFKSIIEFEKFAKYVSCIGNFVLVPAGFNGYRGTHSCLKDYWDLSLDYLLYAKRSWLECEEKSVKRNKGFKQYINTFFLWDYVESTKDNYEVKDLFPSHKEKLGGTRPLSNEKIYPIEREEYSKFFNNVNKCIRRRGQFMVEMLRIATSDEEGKRDDTEYPEWKEWNVTEIYKKIMKEVFLADTAYPGYKEVVEKIEKTVAGYAYVQDILEELQGKLEINSDK